MAWYFFLILFAPAGRRHLRAAPPGLTTGCYFQGIPAWPNGGCLNLSKSFWTHFASRYYSQNAEWKARSFYWKTQAFLDSNLMVISSKHFLSWGCTLVIHTETTPNRREHRYRLSCPRKRDKEMMKIIICLAAIPAVSSVSSVCSPLPKYKYFKFIYLLNGISSQIQG